MESGIKEILKCGDQEFSFRLNRKQETELGPVTIDQWWMHVNQLYAQGTHRDEQEQNHRRVLEFYWAKVREENAIDVRDAQERYLLGSLLPQLRSLGSRRIFLDSTLRRERGSTRDEETEALDDTLRSSRDGTVSESEFRDRCWDLLGRSEFPEGAEDLYNEMLPQLLDEPCVELSNDNSSAARKLVEQNWADFHHCYSVVWNGLMPHLAHKYELNQESMHFLEFWHKDRINQELSDERSSWSLFHGHVFGLHPGLWRFLLTQTGQELMGECLQEPKSTERMERMLNSFLMSLFDYQERWSTQNTSRRGGREFASGNMAEVETDQIDRSESRRHQAPADEDDDWWKDFIPYPDT